VVVKITRIESSKEKESRANCNDQRSRANQKCGRKEGQALPGRAEKTQRQESGSQDRYEKQTAVLEESDTPQKTSKRMIEGSNITLVGSTFTERITRGTRPENVSE